MNKTQTNYFNMFLNVQEFFNDNSQIWSNIPRTVSYKNDFDEIIVLLREKSGVSIESISVSNKKDKLKEQIAQKTSAILGILTAFAHEKDDMDLAKQVDLSKSAILRLKDTELVPKVTFFISIARQYIEELADFGLSEASLTELEAMADEFNGLIGKPRSIRNKKFVALSEVEQLINEGNNLLKNKLDKLMLMFRESNPAFYDGYHRARVIVDR
jgi:hypothetical protein